MNVYVRPATCFIGRRPASGHRRTACIPNGILAHCASDLSRIQNSLAIRTSNDLLFSRANNVSFRTVAIRLPNNRRRPFLFAIGNLATRSRPKLNTLAASASFRKSCGMPSCHASGFLSPGNQNLAANCSATMTLPNDNSRCITRAIGTFSVNRNRVSLQVSGVSNTANRVNNAFRTRRPSSASVNATRPISVGIRNIFCTHLRRI